MSKTKIRTKPKKPILTSPPGFRTRQEAIDYALSLPVDPERIKKQLSAKKGK